MEHMSVLQTQQRLLITFGKSGALKYTSNLDVAKIWERVLRRAELPMEYSRGFNIRPRMQLASPLPLGITSDCELVDVSLKEAIDLTGLRERLLRVSPPGLEIHHIDTLEVRHPALQTLVESAEYRIHFVEPVANLAEIVAALLARDQIIRTEERKGRVRVEDLRPNIYDLVVDDQGDLIAHVAVGSNGNVRPKDLMEELGLQNHHHTIHRQRLNLAPAGK
jgi:radical SAM-linked protein